MNFARIMLRVLCVFFGLFGFMIARADQAEPNGGDLVAPSAYRAELSDLHILQDYRPCKNSFVLGLETRSERPPMIRAGERRTILRAAGTGSLRHIWETHRGTPAPFILEFFIDGEPQPSIRGSLADIIDAARNAEQRFAINPGGVVPKNSYNLYLPVPFNQSLRVDLVAIAPIDLVFLQLDYRLEDPSLKGVRLVQEGQGADLRLAYTGLPRLFGESRKTTLLTQRFDTVTGQAVALKGPGIIRRLAVEAPPGARLRMSFDNASSPAVDALVADFFGPFRGPALSSNQCFLPMPFKTSAEIMILPGASNAPCRIQADLEKTPAFSHNWGWFHAKSSEPQQASGFEPVQVLYARGRGHWLGMSIYRTGHDHGGGDFAVVDAESPTPGFLHGINGEDYFSFAWFGRGENFPYSEAFDNDTGRLRLHLENPYPFRKSIQIGWGTLQGQNPRAVSYWYQDTPADKTLSVAESRGLRWEVFGPREAPLRPDGYSPDTSSVEHLFAPLPAESALDSGQPLPIVHLYRGRYTGQFNGWSGQVGVGPHLNLMYIYGHVMDLKSNHHMGYYARLMMARSLLRSPRAQQVLLQFSYDDPLEMQLNGQPILEDLNAREGFVTKSIPARLVPGENRLLIRMVDTPNNNTGWAALSLRVLDRTGRDITHDLQ